MSNAIIAVILGLVIGIVLIILINEVIKILTSTKYLITIEFTKHGGKYYPKGPKSNSHKGTNINNQFSQFIIKVNKPWDMLDTINELMENKFPDKNTNWKIVKMTKIEG